MTTEDKRARSTTRKTTFIGSPGQATDSVLQATEETYVGREGIVEETTSQLGQCGAGHEIIHSEADIGGVCLCGHVLCLEHARVRCARCGCCVCDACCLRIGNAVYCRRHGIQELAGRFLAFSIAAMVLSGLVAIAWWLASS